MPLDFNTKVGLALGSSLVVLGVVGWLITRDAVDLILPLIAIWLFGMVAALRYARTLRESAGGPKGS
jgi:hypothetical protein